VNDLKTANLPEQESYTVYRGAALKPSKRINYTSWFLVALVVAGLIAWGVSSLHEAGY
jgi:hypothetical protein